MAMKLEYLSSEVLFDIFDHMTLGQILHSFQFLNSRFNQLFFVYLRIIRHLDLRFASLRDCDIFYRSQLPKIVNQIISLTVSNSDETPLQVEFFCYDNLRFRQFINLQSLSLYHIHSQEIMMEISLEWDYLPHLIHIKLVDCCLSSGNDVNQSLTNKIWSMPKLIRFNISTRSCKEPQELCPSVISSSLKYVSIHNSAKISCLLSNILRYTPRLRYLYFHPYFGNGYATLPILPSLVKFEFNEERSLIPFVTIISNELDIFLQKIPNLCHLTITSLTMFMDGYQWENIISNYLPKLKTFQCKTTIYFYNLDEIKTQLYDLIRSFHSHFWIENHQWFIRCHLKLENQSRYYILYYTLPYIFTPSILVTDYVWSVSTSSYEKDYLLPDFVQDSLMKINLNTNQITSTERSVSVCERISNIFRLNWDGTKYLTPSSDITAKISNFTNTRNLFLELPFEQGFSKFIPKLDQLISLNVSFHTKYPNSSDLQVLLDRAPNLYSLNIVCPGMPITKFFLTDIRNVSVRSLGLPHIDSFSASIFYNLEQCVVLSHSPLGKQCEILSIGVLNKECIIYLINEMINLRLLTVATCDNYITSSSLRKESYDLITWLKLTLPSTIKIGKSCCCKQYIHFWIR